MSAHARELLAASSWQALDHPIVRADCLEVMRSLPECSIDAIVTDPPYGIGFMGHEWDQPGDFGPVSASHGYDLSPSANQRFQAWCGAWAREALRVLKPGGHAVVFGGTRTFHRLTCGLEDAGFEIRDTLMWLFGAGFPKAWNFDTQYPDDGWCKCGNALPYDHAESPAEHDLRRVRAADLPAAERVGSQRGEVLLEGMSEHGAPAHGQARNEPGDARIEQPGVEGRLVHRAGQGVPDGEDAEPRTGSEERVRAGAHPSDGAGARPAARGGRGGAPHQSGSRGQSPGEPAGVRQSRRALDDGALRDGGRCARCGQLDQAFHGFSTALKPAHELIVLARKPLAGTVAANVLEHGTGAVNVDACRIGFQDGERIQTRWNHRGSATINVGEGVGSVPATGEDVYDPSKGRWPANVILDEEAAALLDAQTGELRSGFMAAGTQREGLGYRGGLGTQVRHDTIGDSGGASRFFYCAKTSRAERNAGLDGFAARPSHWSSGETGTEREASNHHPTVKPIALMRWLLRLVGSMPDAVVLDPFAGSGTTVCAGQLVEPDVERIEVVGIERDAGYAEIARARAAWWAENPEGFAAAKRAARRSDQKPEQQTDILTALAELPGEAA